MKSRGLRGSQLEEMINFTIEDYRRHRLALIQKIPTPITPMKMDSKTGHIISAFFDKKSTVDYIGVVQEIAVCFDAKETDTLRFPMKNIHAHQYEFMKEWEMQEGVSFLLIFFRNIEKAYYMRFSELDKLCKKGVASFNFESLDEKYIIDLKNKVKIDFLQKLQLDINER